MINEDDSKTHHMTSTSITSTLPAEISSHDPTTHLA